MVAVARDDKIEVETMPRRGTSETLMPAVRRLVAGGMRLDGVGVVVGPGSFTGVRVGLSAAKGLCEALGVGMVAMSRLALVTAAGSRKETLAMLDAGRNEYYCGVYRETTRVAEVLLNVEDARSAMEGRETITCEARVAERVGARLVAEPGAASMLLLMKQRVTAGDWSDIESADANYLRRTDAELLRAVR